MDDNNSSEKLSQLQVCRAAEKHQGGRDQRAEENQTHTGNLTQLKRGSRKW